MFCFFTAPRRGPACCDSRCPGPLQVKASAVPRRVQHLARKIQARAPEGGTAFRLHLGQRHTAARHLRLRPGQRALYGKAPVFKRTGQSVHFPAGKAARRARKRLQAAAFQYRMPQLFGHEPQQKRLQRSKHARRAALLQHPAQDRKRHLRKKSTLVPAFFTPGPSRHESCMAGIPERPYSANCTSPRSVPAHRPSRYSESAQLARTPFNPTGNPAHRSGTRHGYGSATLWPSMRAKAKAEPSVPNCGPA